MSEIGLYYFTLLYSHYSIIFCGVHEGSRRCLDAKKQKSKLTPVLAKNLPFRVKQNNYLR
jgi:hypothetical protein